MATSYIHRLTFVIPASLQASVNAWIAANIDSVGGSNWFTVELSATGISPPTYYWVNTSLTDAQCLAILQKVCQLASITPTSTWSSMTQAEKIAYVASIQASIQSATQIYILLDNNLGSWTQAATVLTTLLLQFIPPGS
jgi:hypothetical protein